MTAFYMEFSDIFSTLSAISALFLFVVLLSVVFIRKLKDIRSEHRVSLAKLEKKMSSVTSASVGMGQRLLELEQKFIAVRDAQDEFKNQDLDFSYIQAHKLIEQGLSSDAVAANSGLSLSEVSLMELMHCEARSGSDKGLVDAPENSVPNQSFSGSKKSFRSSGLAECV